MHMICTQTQRHTRPTDTPAAEARSAGEIVTILTGRSDDYRDVALAWAALVALVSLLAMALFPDFYLGLIDRLTGAWRQQWHPAQLFEVAALVALVDTRCTEGADWPGFLAHCPLTRDVVGICFLI